MNQQLEAFVHVFRQKLHNILKYGFEGWSGRIEIDGIIIEIDITRKDGNDTGKSTS